MKRNLLIVALAALAASVNAAFGASAPAKSTPSPGLRDLNAEFQYARDMARLVHEQIELYGSNRSVRSQIKKVDDEILQVNREISTRKYDRDQIHAEVVRIDDELHSIDLELRDLSVHQPATLTGGKRSLLH